MPAEAAGQLDANADDGYVIRQDEGDIPAWLLAILILDNGMQIPHMTEDRDRAARLTSQQADEWVQKLATERRPATVEQIRRTR